MSFLETLAAAPRSMRGCGGCSPAPRSGAGGSSHWRSDFERDCCSFDGHCAGRGSCAFGIGNSLGFPQLRSGSIKANANFVRIGPNLIAWYGEGGGKLRPESCWLLAGYLDSYLTKGDFSLLCWFSILYHLEIAFCSVDPTFFSVHFFILFIDLTFVLADPLTFISCNNDCDERSAYTNQVLADTQ